ncbi:MAG: hypothetical protein WAO12_07090 [Venatoribacter sp.]
MSTTALVIIASFTALAAVLALTFIKWQDQRNIKKARTIVNHNDNINLANDIGSQIGSLLSEDMLKFLASYITKNADALAAMKVKPTRNVMLGLENARIWSATKTEQRSLIAQSENQLRVIHTLLLNLNALIKKIYKARGLDKDLAKTLLDETHLVDMKALIDYHLAKARLAKQISNHSLAIHHYKKLHEIASKTALAVDKLGLNKAELLNKIKEHEALRNQNASANRLDDAAKDLADEDSSWMKKRY